MSVIIRGQLIFFSETGTPLFHLSLFAPPSAPGWVAEQWQSTGLPHRFSVAPGELGGCGRRSWQVLLSSSPEAGSISHSNEGSFHSTHFPEVCYKDLKTNKTEPNNDVNSTFPEAMAGRGVLTCSGPVPWPLPGSTAGSHFVMFLLLCHWGGAGGSVHSNVQCQVTGLSAPVHGSVGKKKVQIKCLHDEMASLP